LAHLARSNLIYRLEFLVNPDLLGSLSHRFFLVRKEFFDKICRRRSRVGVESQHSGNHVAYHLIFPEILIQRNFRKNSGHFILNGVQIEFKRALPNSEFIENASQRPDVGFVIIRRLIVDEKLGSKVTTCAPYICRDAKGFRSDMSAETEIG